VLRMRRREGFQKLGHPERRKGCASAQRKDFGHAKL
jgi:hypothetical protein